jgi:hypothetical protein
MRSLWVASGLALALLSLAAAFRPAPVPEIASVPAKPIGPYRLSTEDLSQIMALRAQFGSAADRFEGVDASPAAFEEQLRQAAGLSGSSPASANDPPAGGSTLAVQAAPSQELLRQAAEELDRLANDSERAADYHDADELRSLADQVRRVARVPTNPLPPVNTDNPSGGLIDNRPAAQPQ